MTIFILTNEIILKLWNSFAQFVIKSGNAIRYFIAIRYFLHCN